MSWQRILETARRRGLPLIVTDPAGREPVVILSLQEYERLSEERGPVAPAVPPADIPVRIERREPTVVPTPTPAPSVPSVRSTVEPPSAPMTGEISLEERFYLEPVEDGQD